MRWLRRAAWVVMLVALVAGCSQGNGPTPGPAMVTPSMSEADTPDVSTALPTITQTAPFIPTSTLMPTATVMRSMPTATQTPILDQYQIETLSPGQYLVGEKYNPDSSTFLHFVSLDKITYRYDLEQDISVVLSPDLQQVAFSQADHLWIMELQSRTIVEVLNSQGCKFPDWSPDGKSLVAMCQSGIGVITLASGERMLITNWSTTEEAWSFPTWSPDGQWIAYINRPTSLGGAEPNDGIYVTNTACLTNNATCESMTLGPFTQAFHPPIDWSPDSRSLAVVTRTSISILDVETGVLRQVLEGDYYPSVVVWSPDGEWIAFDAYARDITIVSTQGGEPIVVMQPPPSISLIDWITIPHPFAPSDIYTITEAGENLNLRDAPSLVGAILRKLQPGDTVTILSGPVQADGYTWWQMQTADGTIGWAVNIPEWYAPVEH